MNRTATTEALKALIAAHAAEIAALKVENEKLAQRVVHLEEQLRLERLHRYAPRSEKLTERIFNEAEQAAAEGEATEDVEAAAAWGAAGPSFWVALCEATRSGGMASTGKPPRRSPRPGGGQDGYPRVGPQESW